MSAPAGVGLSDRPIVPMPRWAIYTGCARFVFAILALAFTAAAVGIWHGVPALGIEIFTVSLARIYDS
jgi:hypothetical protein